MFGPLHYNKKKVGQSIKKGKRKINLPLHIFLKAGYKAYSLQNLGVPRLLIHFL